MASDPTLTRRLLLGHGFGAAVLASATAAAARGVATVAAAHPATGAHRLRKPGAGVEAPLIVLDPGHGGKDPGAIGGSGLHEKDVALSLAYALQTWLRKAGRYRVRLTRQVDTFLPLAERVALAQSWGAALFVSVHADAVADHRVRGASVYTLATQASDPQTAALASRENAVDRFARRAPNAEVADILVSLVRRETRLGSAKVQQRILAGMRNEVPLLVNPARHAAFAVLQSAEIPSVLVETGFMSNAWDEAALSTPAHRWVVASAIGRGIEAYLA